LFFFVVFAFAADQLVISTGFCKLGKIKRLDAQGKIL